MKNIFSFLIYRFQAVTSEDAQYVASIPSEDSIQYMEKLKLADEWWQSHYYQIMNGTKKWLKCHPLSGGTLQITLWELPVHTLNSVKNLKANDSNDFFAEGHALDVYMNDTGDWRGILILYHQ